MSNTSTRSNESAYDLFDRWMALRQQERDAAAGPRNEKRLDELPIQPPHSGGAGAPPS